MSIKPTDEAVYTDEEIAHLRDELAKRMLNTPPQPLKPTLPGASLRSHHGSRDQNSLVWSVNRQAVSPSARFLAGGRRSARIVTAMRADDGGGVNRLHFVLVLSSKRSAQGSATIKSSEPKTHHLTGE